ncbi:hypothetical protein PanWU01x14_162690 [Parasponia andersonii]|uniref:Uncharacterized protein n=1 Tax=Parasponia andersonii TaxID=3476 RepID=A0A2P5CD89_PARAD|nr:hypothetical protein PanWU01x14_162690 [Parasponia andersonii]
MNVDEHQEGIEMTSKIQCILDAPSKCIDKASKFSKSFRYLLDGAFAHGQRKIVVDWQGVTLALK